MLHKSVGLGVLSMAALAVVGVLNFGTGLGVVRVPEVELPVISDDVPDLVKAVAFCIEVVAEGGDNLDVDPFQPEVRHWNYGFASEHFGNFEAQYDVQVRPINRFWNETGLACAVNYRGRVAQADYDQVRILLRRAFPYRRPGQASAVSGCPDGLSEASVERLRDMIVRLSYQTSDECGAPRPEPLFSFHVATFERYRDPRETTFAPSVPCIRF